MEQRTHDVPDDTDGADESEGADVLADLLAFAPVLVNSTPAGTILGGLGWRFLFGRFLRRLCNCSL